MSSWANRNVLRKRDLSQIPLQYQSEVPILSSQPTSKIISLSNSIKNEIIIPSNIKHSNSVPSKVNTLQSSIQIEPPHPSSIELTFNDKSYVFVILRTIHTNADNDLWITSYNSIRKFYRNKIVIIDDYSLINTVNGNLFNTDVIYSEFNGAGSILAYYYFNKFKWADSMIFLQDYMFLQRPFTNEELNHSIRFHWYFDKDSTIDNKLLSFIRILKNNSELLQYVEESNNWKACFKGTLIIDLSIIQLLEQKYKLFTTLVLMILLRKDRELFERLLGLITYFEKLIDDTNCSNFNNILLYPDAFNNENINTQNAINKVSNSSYHTAIIINQWKS